MSEAAASVSKLARAITAIERGEVLEQDVAEFLLRRLDELSGVHERQLTMMYEGVRGALAADDALKAQELETRFRVRETPDWRKHAADLETEMVKRGMSFEVIDWTEDQAHLPFKG